MIFECVKLTIELSDHSRATPITSVLDHLSVKLQHLPLKINLTVWSDVCSAQFRFRYISKLLSNIDSSMNITWCYNGRHWSNFKSCVYHDVMSGKWVIDPPKTICGTYRQSRERYNFLVPSCARCFNTAWRYWSFPEN